MGTNGKIMLCAFAAFSLAAAVPASAQTLRVAIQNTAPLGGDPAGGACFEILNAIGAEYGWQLEFTPISSLADRLGAVVNSTADIMCGGTVISNPRREMGLAFTSPFFGNSEALFVRADDTTAYTSLAELAGKRVGGQEGSVFLRAMEAAGIPFVTVPSNDAGFTALAGGEIDAFVTGVANRYLTDVAQSLPGIRSVDSYVPVVEQPAGIVVRPADTQLLGQLQASLEAMKASGALNAILATWSLPPPAF